jgi:hypothetical protein
MPDFGGFEFALLCLIVFGGAVVQGTLGFAFGMVAMGFAALVMDARTASIVVSPLALINISSTLWSVRRNINLRLVAPIVIGTLVGIPFGLAILLGGSLLIIKVLLAALLLYVGVSNLLEKAVHKKPLPPWVAIAAGLGVGVIGGATNIGGPPLIAYAARQPWDAETFKATLLTTFFISSGTKTGILIANGRIDGTMLLAVAALALPIIIGSLIGVRLFNKIDRKLFGRIIGAVLILLAFLVVL